jgi:hypothetical protein
MHQDHHDEPIRVRIVPSDRYEYDNSPDGPARLAFDAWVLRVLIVLYVIGCVVL